MATNKTLEKSSKAKAQHSKARAKTATAKKSAPKVHTGKSRAEKLYRELYAYKNALTGLSNFLDDYLFFLDRERAK